MIRLSIFVSEIFYLLLRCAAPFYPKAKAFIRARKEIFPELTEFRRRNPGHLTWFHCASLGEYEMAKPLMQMIRENGKTDVLLVTFFSSSGYDQRKTDPLPDGVFYLPADGNRRAARFLEIVKPDLAYFVKYDFWPGYIYRLKQTGVPAILINAVFRKEQIFFKSYGTGMLQLLKSFAHIFVQYAPSAELLAQQGIHQVSISGDLRFDRVAQISENRVTLPLIQKFCDTGFTVIAGSSWPAEETLLASVYRNLQKKGIKILIVPHDVSENHLQNIENLFTDFHCQRLSRCSETLLPKTDVLMVDTIGKLVYSYPYAQLALVGGGFSGKLHNILESLVHGVPVLFGPNIRRFQEAEYFVKQGSAFAVHNAETLTQKILFFRENPLELARISEQCRAQTAQMKGAVLKVYHEIYG